MATPIEEMRARDYPGVDFSIKYRVGQRAIEDDTPPEGGEEFMWWTDAQRLLLVSIMDYYFQSYPHTVPAASVWNMGEEGLSPEAQERLVALVVQLMQMPDGTTGIFTAEPGVYDFWLLPV